MTLIKELHELHDKLQATYETTQPAINSIRQNTSEEWQHFYDFAYGRQSGLSQALTLLTRTIQNHEQQQEDKQ